MRRLTIVGLAVLLSACGGSGGSGPAQRPFEGTWTGSYTNSVSGQATATLQLTQEGQTVMGTLTTSVGRRATMGGTVSGDQVEGEFAFTDDCGGTATTTAMLRDEVEPDALSGTYAATDCFGDSGGGYSLVRQ